MVHFGGWVCACGGLQWYSATMLFVSLGKFNCSLMLAACSQPTMWPICTVCLCTRAVGCEILMLLLYAAAVMWTPQRGQRVQSQYRTRAGCDKILRAYRSVCFRLRFTPNRAINFTNVLPMTLPLVRTFCVKIRWWCYSAWPHFSICMCAVCTVHATTKNPNIQRVLYIRYTPNILIVAHAMPYITFCGNVTCTQRLFIAPKLFDGFIIQPMSTTINIYMFPLILGEHDNISIWLSRWLPIKLEIIHDADQFRGQNRMCVQCQPTTTEESKNVGGRKNDQRREKVRCRMREMCWAISNQFNASVSHTDKCVIFKCYLIVMAINIAAVCGTSLQTVARLTPPLMKTTTPRCRCIHTNTNTLAENYNNNKFNTIAHKSLCVCVCHTRVEWAKSTKNGQTYHKQSNRKDRRNYTYVWCVSVCLLISERQIKHGSQY